MLHNSKLARAFVTFVTFVFSTLIWFRTFLEKVVAFPVLVANGCCFVGPRYLETKTKNDERYVKLNFVLYACKGPGNIYGNTGPGNLQRDHRLF